MGYYEILDSNTWNNFLSKFLAKLSNEELWNWKLSIKLSLLLTQNLIYFSNPFGMTFILRFYWLVLA